MLIQPQQLADSELEDILLLGARGVPTAPRAPRCAEPAPRYNASPERRSQAVKNLLHVAGELQRREGLKQLQQEHVVFDTLPAVGRYLVVHFAHHTAEAFVVVFLNAHNRVLTVEEMFQGTLTQAAVYPREVVRRALHHNAASIVIAHNHPSGEVLPSKPDLALTKLIKKALDAAGIGLLDHLIVGGEKTYSFLQNGIL